MLSLVGSLDGTFEQLDFHFGPPGWITFDLFVQFPNARHYITLHTSGNTREQFGRRRAKNNKAADQYFEARRTLLLFDSGYDSGALRPQQMRELNLRETPAKAV